MKPQLKWEDLVFENRNQEYGAYDLRSAYAGRVVLSFAAALLAIAMVMAYPSVVKFFQREKPAKAVAKAIKYTDLAAPPPIDKNTPPPPKVDIPPPVKEAIKFLPPKVTEKEVDEEIPTVDEFKKTEVAAETTEGTGEIIFDEPVEEAVDDGEDPDKVYLIVEQQPEFPGGMGALMKFIAQKMKYPPQARRMGIDGQVYVSFVVDADGKITDAQVIKGIGGGCDQEAVRVIESMPPWKPGKQGGRPVKVRFVLPVKFVLG